MITFILAVVILIAGYLVYGKIVEKVFVPTDNPTPAMVHPDGVDYVAMPTWKVYLIQLLNIAGTGPIFGALMGACFGPVVFLWIVFGNILGGAVHDYFSGMISLRMDGASISEIVGRYLGKSAQEVMHIFSVILMILVGAVFTTSPAALLARLTPDWMGTSFWIVVILVYYFLATLLPIDKLIGKIYPLFGVLLLLMALSISGAMIFQGYVIPELTLQNLHPENIPVFPYMFITVACGAISGFHATQSPMMARCLNTEKNGRKIFYGAMIAEGLIALVWAAAGVAFYEGTGGLFTALSEMGQSGVVYDIAVGLLGSAGGILAIVGVIVCPISTGDTAFRSARLMVSDWFHLDQSSLSKRTLLAIPLLLLGAALTLIDFDIIWRYFSWANQTLAMIVLWAISVYLVEHAKEKMYCLITVLPAAFMTAVTITYILMAEEGFRLPGWISYLLGIGTALLATLWFVYKCFKKPKLIPKTSA